MMTMSRAPLNRNNHSLSGLEVPSISQPSSRNMISSHPENNSIFSSTAKDLATASTPRDSRDSPRASMDAFNRGWPEGNRIERGPTSLVGQKRRPTLVSKLSRGKKKPHLDCQGSLAEAALSNPELHLASDPLLDTDSIDYRRLIVFPHRLEEVTAQHMLETPRRSFSAAFGLGPVCRPSTSPSQASHSPSRARVSSTSGIPYQPSNNPSASTAYGQTLANDGSPSKSNGDTPARSIGTLRSPETSVSKRRSATEWLKSKRWSAAIMSRASSTAAAEEGNSSEKRHFPTREVSVSSGVYLAGLTPIATNSSPLISEPSSVTFDSEQSRDVDPQIGKPSLPISVSCTSCSSAADEDALNRMRAARTYLFEELSKLTREEIGLDREQASRLGQTNPLMLGDESSSSDSTWDEMLSFWSSINSGVLLCVFANHLKPGVIDRIDRRDVEWVRADNLSRFLRAARDFFSVRSKDLFHPLDLADATVEGLDRAVHTILVIRDAARDMGLSVRSPSSPVTSTTIDRVRSKRRSLVILSHSPRHISTEVRNSDADLSTSLSFPTEAALTPEAGGVPELTIEEHRRAAEAKLTQRISESPEPVLYSGRQTRQSTQSQHPILIPKNTRRKSDSRSPKGPTITFAQSSFGSRSGSFEDLRTGTSWRDVRMSDSELSLGGVAEEETEDAPQVRLNQNAHATGEELSESHAAPLGAPSHRNANRSSGSRVVPVSRSGSQRRISREIAFAQQGLSDGWEDHRANLGGAKLARPQASPRHHSTTNVSSSSSQLRYLQQGRSPSPTARVPFPSTPSILEMPSVNARTSSTSKHRRGSGFGETAVESSPLADDLRVPNSLLTRSTADATSRLAGPQPTRPPYRHLRYTSELQLPVSQGNFSRREILSPSSSASGNEISPGRSARPRCDTETSLSTKFSMDKSDSGETWRDVRRKESLKTTSRHKIDLVEDGGKTRTTFQMGNCIGRGQFGSVYRALNLNTGQMVAVKRIKIEGRSEGEVTQLMKEVDLLKSLNHTSVVRYEGLVRGTDAISIILEYVENGSLLHTLKAFGQFPERLVASYVVKILEGLAYLHEMKVVHCDLKAANILTTKNGNVKLSDFGVSLSLQAMEKVQNNDAIGTPNWMAPEVIELKGASTAADIWSLGCTIIELLTGKPPYGDLLAMSAMFRIVEDEQPPIPEKCSEDLRDFLIQCFRKDPTQRPNAESLFKHPWLLQSWSAHKEMGFQDSLPFLKRISSDAALTRRTDVRALHVVLDEAHGHPATTPSQTQTPPPRPVYRGLRASTVPTGDAWSSTQSMELSNLDSDCSGLFGPSVVALKPNPQDENRKGNVARAELSLLDLNSRPLKLLQQPGGAVKEHQFVKSTFSRNLRCKLCQQSVRKHAVFCEECGLMCHARCAREIASTCDIRAHLILFHQLQQSQVDDSVADQAETSAADNTSQSEVSNETLVSNSTSLFSARLKYAISKSKRLSKGQITDVDDSEGAYPTDPCGGIERDAPALATAKHGQDVVVGLSTPIIDHSRDGEQTELHRIGKKRHRFSFSGTESRQASYFPFPTLVEQKRHSTTPTTSQEEVSLSSAKATIRESLLRTGHLQTQEGGKQEQAPSDISSVDPRALLATAILPAAGVSDQQQQFVSHDPSNRGKAFRPQPAHPVSRSAGDLATIRGLVLGRKKENSLAAPPPSPLPPGSHEDTNRRGNSASDPEHREDGLTSTVEEKRRTRRLSLTSKKEECTIM